jgi:dolichyl-phosphate-mannose--protein O-mannosyl transferase
MNILTKKIGPFLVRHKEWFILAIVIIGIFSFRLWRLAQPQEIVFDETYFAKFAQNYLNHEEFFDIHPPLGKRIISLGIIVFGNNYFGYRIMSLILGTLFLLVIYLLAKEIFQKRVVAWIALSIFSLDGMFFVYSRTALIDIFTVFFYSLSLLFFWKAIKKNSFSPLLITLTGIFFGLAISVKWLVLPGAILLAFWLAFKKRPLDLILLTLVSLNVYLLGFVGQFPWHGWWLKVIEWHQQSWGYNIGLTEGHPYGARWYTWPLLIRPIWFYFQQKQDTVYGIVALGNPLLWIGATIGVVGSLVVSLKSRIKPLIFLLLGYFLCLLPWILVKRVIFIYHYLLSLTFAYLILAFWLGKIWERKWGKLVVILFLLVAGGLFIYFYPIYSVYPISYHHFQQRMWLRSWY